ncbi:hypothetical protein NP493_446g01033 [Ridgeia piscesae]|uniref:Eukaryotic translation initiation factor 2A n=1 Tax=Ridgeia piscesae TaxID=27915 RepID=A0AAD9L0V7_RIDPI|nr:hypothetical protein NP493_446g01033 [Ridgeia piscesae]
MTCFVTLNTAKYHEIWGLPVMAAPMSNVPNMPGIALRGSEGAWLLKGPPGCQNDEAFPRKPRCLCKVMTFNSEGTLFAYCDGTCVTVLETGSWETVTVIDRPRTHCLQFSPRSTILAVWQPYVVSKDTEAGTPNLNLYDVKTGVCVKGFVQKKQDSWCPQWTTDETIAARNVNNEIHFYENNNYDVIVQKLHVQKVSHFRLPPKGKSPYHVAIYVPGSKGQPSYVRIFRYPNFAGPQSALANKSFYKADKSDLIWNDKGSSLLILTVTDSSAESYYGEQGLYYADVKGETCLVPRAKNGPVYSVEWNPNCTEFCIVYGFMPAKATLYNLKCEPVFDFGTGPRNVAYFNPQGNILCLAGFGNLHGNMELWDLKGKKLISNPNGSDSTYFEWCPDGEHMLTATTAPRLRVNNGYRVWHYTGGVVHEESIPTGQELWQAMWQTAGEGVFPPPSISYRPVVPVQQVTQDAKKAYVPPALRNQPGALSGKPKYRDAYEPASNMKKTEPGECLHTWKINHSPQVVTTTVCRAPWHSG